MLVVVYEPALAAGIVAPKHKDKMLPAAGEQRDNRICKLLPPQAGVGGRLICPYGKHCIKQKDPLPGPSGKVSAS